MIKNITFVYADKVNTDKNREHALINQANLWFSPFEKELNEQKGCIEFFLKGEYENRVLFRDMEKSLEDKLYDRIKYFQVQY